MDFKKNSGTAAGVIGAAAFLLAFFSVFSHAQQRPDAGSVLEGTKQPAVTPKLGVDVLPRAPEPRPALAAPGLKLVVSGFRVTGNTIYAEKVLADEVKEFVGKEQTIDGLNDAATKVRAYYRERGYFLVQAYLPQQEIKDGVVEIAVIEARIGKVALNLKEGTRYSENLVRGIIEAHLVTGEIITEAGLETPLLMLNDLPNATVTSEIKPSQTLGAADLVISVSDTPGLISGSVDFDNHGNRFIGAFRAGVSFDLSNPLALGDQLSYRGFTSDEQFSFYRVAYLIPVGYWGTRVGASYSTFHYQLGKDFVDVRAHGAGAVTTVFALHPIIRTRGSNLILQFAYESKSLDDRRDSVSKIEHRKIDSSKLGAVGDFRDGMLGGGLNSYSFTITEGNVLIDPLAVLVEDQAEATGRKTAGRFAKKNFEFRRLQKITDNMNLLLSVNGQMASKNMASAEKFSLGGTAGVRAYPNGEALGDTGYVFQGELRYIIPGFKLGSGDVSAVGFWDQGWVRVNENKFDSDSANNRRISGYGVGTSIGKDSEFVVRAFAAWRNENERPTSDTASRIPRIWVQGIKWF